MCDLKYYILHIFVRALFGMGHKILPHIIILTSAMDLNFGSLFSYFSLFPFFCEEGYMSELHPPRGVRTIVPFPAELAWCIVLVMWPSHLLKNEVQVQHQSHMEENGAWHPNHSKLLWGITANRELKICCWTKPKRNISICYC